MVMVFDAKGPTSEMTIMSLIKNRPPMPNELRVQIDDIKTLRAILFSIEEVVGVEADDVIATLAEKFGKIKKS